MTAALMLGSVDVTAFAETTGVEESTEVSTEENTEVSTETENQDQDLAAAEAVESEVATETTTEEMVSAEEAELEAAKAEREAVIQALQERIHALPTVEEFRAMADGTLHEGSTLSEKQYQVYMEAESISDAYEALSKEEQAQIDTTKLEALFEAFNSAVMPALNPSDLSCTFGTITLYDSGCLKSMQMSIQDMASHATAVGKIAIYSQKSQYGWDNRYSYATDAQWPATVENDGFLAWGDGDEFTWTDRNKHDITVNFTDGAIPLSGKDATYYVYLWTRSTSYGIYPDAILTNLQVKNGQLIDASGNVLKEEHKHSWKYVPSETEENVWNVYCTEPKVQCEYYGTESSHANSVKMTLDISDDVYTGKPYAGVTVRTDKDIPEITAAVDVKYYSVSEDGKTETLLAGAPTDAGDYKVKVTVAGQVTEKSFSIKKPSIQAAAENVTKVYDGNAYGIEVRVTAPTSGYTVKYGEKKGEYTLTESPKYKDFGEHTVYYQVTADNYETYEGQAVVSVTDPYMPTGTITVAQREWKEFVKGISFDIYLKNLQTVTITAADEGSGVDTVSYYIADQGLSEDTVKTLTGWKTYTKPFILNTDKKYVIYAKITDKSGNVAYISSDGMILDGTAPKINGVSDKKGYCGDVTFTISDENLSDVLVDGAEATEFKIVADDKNHTIKAVDKAGNVIEYTVTVYKTHAFSDYVETAREGNLVTEQATCAHCGKVISRIKTITGAASDITKEEDPSGGSLAAEVKVGAGAPQMAVSGLNTTVAKALLTDEEKKKVEQGEHLLVYLEVNAALGADVSSADQTTTEAKAATVGNLKKGMYLDLSMWKKIGTADAEKLGSVETSGMITVSLTLPEELKAPAGKTRTYYMIRVHDGVPTLLETVLNGDVITFQTNQFSTYSIWYTEADAAPGTGGNTGDPGNGGNGGSSDTPGNGGSILTAENPGNGDGNIIKTVVLEQTGEGDGAAQAATQTAANGTPKTGDNSNLALWMTVLLTAMVVLAELFVKQKRNFR